MKTLDTTFPSVALEVSPAQVQADSGSFLLLDVRTPAEFEEAHVPGSVLVPLQDLDPVAVQKLAADVDRCYILCRSGQRSRQAVQKLQNAGIKSLQVVQGGVQAWEAAGLPLNRGRKTLSLERQVRIIAGALVVVGAVLGYLVHPAWVGLSGFVGAGLVFAGITDTCGMAMVLARMPWNQRSGCRDGSCRA